MATTSDMHLDDVFYKKADDFFAANAGTGLTYDDVSLATCFSDVLPRMTRLEASADQTQRLLSRVFHGKASLLLHSLVDAGQVTAEEMRELLEMLERK